MKIEDLINPEDDISEIEKENLVLKPLLKEINLIHDPGVKDFVRSILLRAPSVFWNMPSTYVQDQNPPDEYGPTGNILHTQRVTRACIVMSEWYTLPDMERDILIAAGLLHDLTKGLEIKNEDEEYIQFDPYHAYTVDKFVKSVQFSDQMFGKENQSTVLYASKSAVEEILKLIRCQYGPESLIPETIPQPDSFYQLLFVAHSIATNLHFLADGDEIKKERW